MEGVLVRPDSAVLTRRRSPAGLARRSPSSFARSTEGVHRGAAKEAAGPGPSRDRGRQRFARQVRLPQPMGAGGRAVDGDPFGASQRRAGTEQAEAFTVKSRATRSWKRQRELTAPLPGADDAYVDAAQRRKPCAGVRFGRKAEHERHRDAQADKRTEVFPVGARSGAQAKSLKQPRGQFGRASKGL